jgi:outer membrane protein assembly factor BamB
MANGVLYASNGLGFVEAIDPSNGKTLWTQEPVEPGLDGLKGAQSARGVAYWSESGHERILSVRGNYLYAINAKSGKPVADFGTGGRVDLRPGLGPDTTAFNWVAPSPIIVRDVVIVGGQGRTSTPGEATIPPGDIRPSYPPHYPPHHPTGSFGVFVTDVRYRGERYNPGYDALYKGRVRWLPDQEGGARGGPRFELRNTITYFPGDGIYMPIVPFHILIESDDQTLAIGRDDPLNPAEPRKQIWQMSDHTEYARRCPVNWFDTSDEVMEAIGVDGPNGLNAFFQRRKEWLQLQLDQENDSVLREAYKNRLYVIHFFSSQKADGRRLETSFNYFAGLIGLRLLMVSVGFL